MPRFWFRKKRRVLNDDKPINEKDLIACIFIPFDQSQQHYRRKKTQEVDILTFHHILGYAIAKAGLESHVLWSKYGRMLCIHSVDIR
jgi:hypothetical protein